MVAMANDLQPRQRLTGNERARQATALARKYRGGATVRELMDETGYSYGRVYRLLEEGGAAMRRRGAPKTTE
jgi:Helix-turn-helix domain